MPHLRGTDFRTDQGHERRSLMKRACPVVVMIPCETTGYPAGLVLLLITTYRSLRWGYSWNHRMISWDVMMVHPRILYKLEILFWICVKCTTFRRNCNIFHYLLKPPIMVKYTAHKFLSYTAHIPNKGIVHFTDSCRHPFN